MNRQKGSGTRVLLDLQLKQQGISRKEVNGYKMEMDTHLAVASQVASAKADVGLGIEAAALSYKLGFIPLWRERFDLVIPMPLYRSRRLAIMMEIIASEQFKKIVGKIGGYDTSQMGSTTFVG